MEEKLKGFTCKKHCDNWRMCPIERGEPTYCDLFKPNEKASKREKKA